MELLDEFWCEVIDRLVRPSGVEPMHPFHGLYKTECIRTTVFHDGPYKTLADIEFATAGWVDWYNNRRLQGSNGMVPPVEFEQTHYAALKNEKQPV